MIHPAVDSGEEFLDEDQMAPMDSTDTAVRVCRHKISMEDKIAKLTREEMALMRSADALQQKLQCLLEEEEEHDLNELSEMRVVPQAREELEALSLRPSSSFHLPTLRLGVLRRDSNISKL